jgi:HAE1 family hydrophobic/amphiphilic exporter-1
MNLGELSVRRGITTAMLYLCVAGFGLFSLSRLPLDLYPDIEFPVVAVITSMSGASPEDVENLVSRPIEEAVSTVENVEKVTSTSRQGTSLVLIEFGWGIDMKAAEVEVRKNLEIFAEPVLPEDAEKPLTFAFDPSLAPVVYMNINGPLDGYRLRQLAEDEIAPYLARLPGVASADVIGGLEREISVRVHAERLQAAGIAPSQVVDALRGANVIVPAGYVDDAKQELTIQTRGQFADPLEVRDVVVGVRGGRAVPLSEVADVVDGYEEQRQIVTTDGKSAVMMTIRRQSDANTVQVSRAVRDALPKIAARLPAGVEMVPVFDQAEPILNSLKNITDTAWQAFLLTGLVLLAFLRNWRTSLITLLAIPISVVVAFGVMDALDVSLNMISMAGLALAIGMLVDNGIVVLEATFQRVERGEDAVHAAINGAREMAMPVVASTLTTVVVFLPILLVRGMAGQLFRDLSLTICVTLMSSLVVSLSLVPLMASRMLGKGDDTRLARTLHRWTRFLDHLGPLYTRWLERALDHRKWVYAGVALAFVGSLALVPVMGVDFFAKNDQSHFGLTVRAEPGLSLTEMAERMAEVERLVREQVPEAILISSDFGPGKGMSVWSAGSSSQGTLRVKLRPIAERSRSQQEIENALSQRFRDLVGLDVEVEAEGMTGSGDLEVKLYAEDLDALRAFGERLRDRVEDIDGAGSVRFSLEAGRPELNLRLDRQRLRVLGLSPAVVANTVSTYFQGTDATYYREGGDDIAVRVQAPKEERADLARLRILPVPLPGGGTVPLASVAKVVDDLGPIDIQRENQRRFGTLSVSAAGVDLGKLTSSVQAAIADLGLPPGFSMEIGGSAQDMQESFANLAWALLAACVLVYMVMASQFESLIEPFVIMFTIPLAVIGVVLALVLTGTTLQVGALVGLILLAGVVVNNGIVLVDVLKNRRLEGMPVRAAAMEAARTRLRPILMTALTTILGMIPLAIGTGDGAETWAPMGRAVAGGMIVSTLLTLFLVPALYLDLAGWVDRRAARKAARRAAAAAAVAAG